MFLSSIILKSLRYRLQFYSFVDSSNFSESLSSNFILNPYSSPSVKITTLLLCLRLPSVFLLATMYLMPSLVMNKCCDFGERLLPTRAATSGFWRWVAIGQARVRAKTSMMGRFLVRWSLGNWNLVYMRVLRLLVRCAKSWFFLSGSEPAPIISQPIISLLDPSPFGLLKEFIRVVRPNQRCVSPSLFYIFASLVRLLPFLSERCEFCDYFSLDSCLSCEGGRSAECWNISCFFSFSCRFFLELKRTCPSIFGKKPSLLPISANFPTPIFFSSFYRWNRKDVCLSLSLMLGTGGSTYQNQIQFLFFMKTPITSRSIFSSGNSTAVNSSSMQPTTESIKLLISSSPTLASRCFCMAWTLTLTSGLSTKEGYLHVRPCSLRNLQLTNRKGIFFALFSYILQPQLPTFPKAMCRSDSKMQQAHFTNSPQMRAAVSSLNFRCRASSFSRLNSAIINQIQVAGLYEAGQDYLFVKVGHIFVFIMLTLYWDLISQPARAVKAVIDLGKLEAELINVDLLKGENKSPEYLSKNPHGKIPFLVHGDFKLAESNAILVYLCEAFPEKLSQYYGTTAQSKAIVNQHLAWAQTSFRPGAVGIIVLKFHGKIKAGKKLTTKELEDAEKKMHDGLKTLETTLAEGKTTFIAGDHLTIADLQIFHEVTNLLIYEIPFNNYTAITAWFNAVLAVPEVRAIHDDFQKALPGFVAFIKGIQADDI